MYIYDIFLNDMPDGNLVADSGDEIFDTEAEARADAHDYIISILEDEYNRPPKDFDIVIYEAKENKL